MDFLYALAAITFAVIVLYLLLRPAPPQFAVEDKYLGTRATDDKSTTYVREPVTRDVPRFRRPKWMS